MTSPEHSHLCWVGEGSAPGPAPAVGGTGNFFLFGFVVGIDRVGQADAMRARGADIVVSDLDDLVDPR